MKNLIYLYLSLMLTLVLVNSNVAHGQTKNCLQGKTFKTVDPSQIYTLESSGVRVTCKFNSFQFKTSKVATGNQIVTTEALGTIETEEENINYTYEIEDNIVTLIDKNGIIILFETEGDDCNKLIPDSDLITADFVFDDSAK